MQVKKLIPEEIDGLLLDPSTNFQYADMRPGGSNYKGATEVAKAFDDMIKMTRETHPHIIVR